MKGVCFSVLHQCDVFFLLFLTELKCFNDAERFFINIAEQDLLTKPKRTFWQIFNTFLFRVCNSNMMVISEKHCIANCIGLLCIVYSVKCTV